MFEVQNITTTEKEMEDLFSVLFFFCFFNIAFSSTARFTVHL